MPLTGRAFEAILKALYWRMAQEELDALASVVQSLKSDLIRLQGAFARDALLSGRHSPASLGDLIEAWGRGTCGAAWVWSCQRKGVSLSKRQMPEKAAIGPLQAEKVSY